MPDACRQLTAGRLLTIWRESGEAAEESVERALLCNAQVLAESCFYQEEPMFESREAVLEALTTREMETLLRWVAQDGAAEVENPVFDLERFIRLREGTE
jgi:hypothetical protein